MTWFKSRILMQNQKSSHSAICTVYNIIFQYCYIYSHRMECICSICSFFNQFIISAIPIAAYSLNMCTCCICEDLHTDSYMLSIISHVFNCIAASTAKCWLQFVSPPTHTPTQTWFCLPDQGFGVPCQIHRRAQ